MSEKQSFKQRILAAAAGIDNGDPPNQPCKEKP